MKPIIIAIIVLIGIITACGSPPPDVPETGKTVDAKPVVAGAGRWKETVKR